MESPHRAPSATTFKPWKLAVSALIIAGVTLVTVMGNADGDRCRQYGRDHGVKTRAWSINEWDSCQYFDGGSWRSVHTDKPMKHLSWSSR